MTKLLGTDATIYIGDAEIPTVKYVTFVPERIPDDIREKWEALYLGPAKQEFSVSYFCIDNAELDAFWQAVAAPDVTELSVWPDATRWFFPGLRGEVQFASIEEPGDGVIEMSGVFTNPPEVHFRNRLAPIVYWLWRYPWYPVRWLARRIRQWREDA